VPLQSGSSELLKKMKRGYTKEWFLNRCEKIRSMVPDVAISTDIIVGFPGESDEDFEHTMDVLEQVRFDQLFSFKYSARPHTAAAEYEEQIPSDIASARLKRLQERHKVIQDEQMQKQLGKTLKVYFEELKSGGKVAGRSDDGRLVLVDGSEELLGKIADVKITDAHMTSLDGELA
jgi:tRNA-2-methylthio-N6-dimethylallyladenosine synthase